MVKGGGRKKEMVGSTYDWKYPSIPKLVIVSFWVVSMSWGWILYTQSSGIKGMESFIGNHFTSILEFPNLPPSHIRRMYNINTYIDVLNVAQTTRK